MTSDNASNNATLIQSLARCLQETGRILDIDAERATIRCLPHIIHLAVMALLVGMGVIKSSEVRESTGDFTEFTEAEMEAIVGDGNEGELSDDENRMMLMLT